MRRLVLVGAGHLHLPLLRQAPRLARHGIGITLLAPGPFHYSGLATGVLAGLHGPEAGRVDPAALLGRHGTVLADHATGLDPVRREVARAGGPPLAYDAVSLDLGSVVPPLPGQDGRPDVVPVKPIAALPALRAALESRFRLAGPDPVRLLVVGGGVTAHEVAAAATGLAARRGARLSLVLLTGPEPLRDLPPGAARRLRSVLAERGVRQVPRRVLRLEGRQAVTQDGAEPFDLLVNATGLAPPPLVAASGLPVTPDGALRVDARLRSVADRAVFAGGDMAALDGHALPRVGVHAVRQAPVLAANLVAALAGGRPSRYRPQRRHLWIMNLGDGTALAVHGRLWWHGPLMLAWKDWLDDRFLAGLGA